VSIDQPSVPIPGAAFALGSAAWIAAFNAASGQPDASAAEPGATKVIAARGAPRNAVAATLRISADEQGRMVVAPPGPGDDVDYVAEWADLLEISGLAVPDAIARSTLMKTKTLRRPDEDTLRLGWTRFAGYYSSDVRVPDFALFTLGD
jgi:hypothetical protein